MKALFLQYAKCSTCVKAKKWLEANSIAYEDRPDCRATPNGGGIKAMGCKKRITAEKIL